MRSLLILLLVVIVSCGRKTSDCEKNKTGILGITISQEFWRDIFIHGVEMDYITVEIDGIGNAMKGSELFYRSVNSDSKHTIKFLLPDGTAAIEQKDIQVATCDTVIIKL